MPDAAREGMFDSIAQRLPVGRVGRPEDIADCGGNADDQRLYHRHRPGCGWRRVDCLIVRPALARPDAGLVPLIACPPSLCLTSPITVQLDFVAIPFIITN
jgi:hypothetical protein